MENLSLVVICVLAVGFQVCQGKFFFFFFFKLFLFFLSLFLSLFSFYKSSSLQSVLRRIVIAVV